jgi:hypothetical protein
MARDPQDRGRHPYTHGSGSNENQAAERGAWPERPQTDELADRQEGDQREHVEDLAADIEGQAYDADGQVTDDERTPPDAADSPDDRKPQGSRAPG